MSEEYDMSNVKDIRTITKISYISNPIEGVSCNMFGFSEDILDGLSYMIMFAYKEFSKKYKYFYDEDKIAEFVTKIAGDAARKILLEQMKEREDSLKYFKERAEFYNKYKETMMNNTSDEDEEDYDE